jgi:arginine deiminase
MIRRRFLQVAPTALVGALAQAGMDRRRFVSSDVGKLRRVLVHEPGPETRKALSILRNDHVLRADELLGTDAREQHRRFVSSLRESGAEVLDTRDLLQAAVERARAAGQFEEWIATVLPALAEDAESVDVDVLLGASDTFVYATDADGRRRRPMVVPLKYHFYVRDLAVMTPRGLVLSNLATVTRSFENTLFRFVHSWAPTLQQYPVLIDACTEGVFLQGGDLLVADESTLLLGVGNLTEPRAARVLAQKLDMDVIAVRLPGTPRRRKQPRLPLLQGLRTTFLHLDTLFSLVAPRVALAVPYFLQTLPDNANPLIDLIESLADEDGVDRPAVDEITSSLAEIGTIQRFKAGSGLLDPTLQGLKLVDFLLQQGYTVLPIGGDGAQIDPVKHVVEHVLHEVRFQAGNVVALEPGCLIACEGNPRTLALLEAAGIEVMTTPAAELTRWHGGPHCMTLPLERG